MPTKTVTIELPEMLFQQIIKAEVPTHLFMVETFSELQSLCLKRNAAFKLAAEKSIRHILDGIPILDLLKKAAQEIKHPSFTLKSGHTNNGVIKFSLASSTSKNAGGAYITDGGSYGNSFMYGWIKKNGWVEFNSHCPQIVKDYIKAFLQNPLDNLKINGQAYNICCFCGSELTNAISRYHGYGPICAEHWGLPWDTTKERAETADEVNKLFEDMK